MLDNPAIRQVQEQANVINKMLDNPAIRQVQEQANRISNMQKVLLDYGFEENENDYSFKNQKDNVSSSEHSSQNISIEKSEVSELEKDIREIVDSTYNENSKNNLNFQQQIMEKYEKWANKNPIFAKIFSKIMDEIIKYLIEILLIYAFIVSVKLPLKLHEDSQVKSKTIYVVPAGSDIEVIPVDIRYYYYIMYTDPLSGKIYDGYVSKKSIKII